MIAEMLRRPLNLPTGRGDVRNVVVVGEGRTLVLRAEIAPDIASYVDARLYAHALATGICVDPRGASFFNHGRTVRVELTPAGGRPTIASVDRCPGPVGTGLTTEALASAMQPTVGRDMDGVAVVSIRAEGETVVIVMDGVAGWREGTTTEMLNGAFLSNFCDLRTGNNPYFNGTQAVRIDTREAGRGLIRGNPITTCPGH